MGILNVTPDSFSDGGRYADAGAAIAAGCRMAAEGADLLDVGGESTRPGAREVPADEELRRVVSVIEGLRRTVDIPISIDTRHACVAEAALAAGADIINDVSAFTHDPAMAGLAAASGAGVVLMHMRGQPATMQEAPVYRDVVAEVAAYLAARVRAAEAAGVLRDAVVVDPGIGFGKTLEHNLALLRHLPALAAAGCPVLVGLSRKRFLGEITGRPVDRRLAAGLAAQAWATLRGASVLRVHDVMEACDAAAVLAKLQASPP